MNGAAHQEAADGSGETAEAALLEQDDGTIVASDLTGTYLYASWNVYFASPFFMRNKMRCGQPFLPSDQGQQTYGSKNDCSYSSTNPKSEYDPAVQKFSIPVVVHVLMHTNGNGTISDAMVQSQIDILNEDFMALPGTNGSPGSDCQVEFYLATVDPNGNATTGITRMTNNNWYNDSGNYKSALYWNTNKYFNIYTNTASGYLGYAYMPQQGGVVGNSIDGVVCHWRAFGRNSPFGPPYNQGRTTTHEAGHYLGLWHTFAQGRVEYPAAYRGQRRVIEYARGLGAHNSSVLDPSLSRDVVANHNETFHCIRASLHRITRTAGGYQLQRSVRCTQATDQEQPGCRNQQGGPGRKQYCCDAPAIDRQLGFRRVKPNLTTPG